jgi:hypothetical protein
VGVVASEDPQLGFGGTSAAGNIGGSSEEAGAVPLPLITRGDFKCGELIDNTARRWCCDYIGAFVGRWGAVTAGRRWI